MIIKLFFIFLFLPIVTLTFAQNVKIPASVAFTIGVINSKDYESEMYIARYKLSPDLREIDGMTIIDKGNPLFNLPTTCVMVDDYLYCLANTSLRIFLQKKMNYENELRNPVILKYKIPE